MEQTGFVCRLCPRQCGIDRHVQTGVCRSPDRIRAARAALHLWEEPCISGTRGSGTVFFSGCALRCVFCQNYAISSENFGIEITVGQLAEIFLDLQRKGAHNINLVSAAHYGPWVREALRQVKGELRIPVVYNSGGYESVEELKNWEGYVDVYLPDLKFVSPDLSARYCGAPDYFAVAGEAIKEMYRQVGPVQTDPDGMLQRGMVIRHLVMPGMSKDSFAVLDWIRRQFEPGSVYLSLMSQFCPTPNCKNYPEINRRISTYEYNKVLDYALSLGLEEGFSQERSSAKEEYTPPFDLEGLPR